MDLKSGQVLIDEERKRQQTGEGFDSGRDDEYTKGELAQAGNCFSYVASLNDAEQGSLAVPAGWPETWDEAWWKPKNRLRNLARAGALYQAEIERLQRARKVIEERIEAELVDLKLG